MFSWLPKSIQIRKGDKCFTRFSPLIPEHERSFVYNFPRLSQGHTVNSSTMARLFPNKMIKACLHFAIGQ